MTVDLAAKLAFLRSLATFDHVGKCIETHMSFVFLTEHRAFKLKKPVRLPYLDYTTLAARRRSCENELRLGRRLAADVYEQVVPLVVSARGFAIDGEGEVVDWLVVMRRLPADRMLPEMLANATASAAHAEAVGDVLARFYRETCRAKWTGPAYRQRLRELVVSVAGELVARGASRTLVDEIAGALLAGFADHARILDARIAAGRVVDAHGDLRPEHVCLETPPVIIDPLEFDEGLRTLDAASELAFFGLECERLGAAWFGERVLARYAERAQDDVRTPLIALYRSQHAITRALLALRHLDDARLSDHGRWQARAADYLERAHQFAAEPRGAQTTRTG